MRSSIARYSFVIMRRRLFISWLVLATYLIATLVGRELHLLTCAGHLGASASSSQSSRIASGCCRAGRSSALRGSAASSGEQCRGKNGLGIDRHREVEPRDTRPLDTRARDTQARLGSHGETDGQHDCADCVVCQTLSQAQSARHERLHSLVVERSGLTRQDSLQCRPALHRSLFQSRGPPKGHFIREFA